MHCIGPGPTKMGKPTVETVEYERYVELFEPFAKLRTVTILQLVIQDDGRQSAILHSNEGVSQGQRGYHTRAFVGERICDVQCDKRFILANEDQATSQAGAVHVWSCPRCYAHVSERCRSILRRCPQAVDQSSARNKRNDRLAEGPGRVARTDRVLRDV